MKKIILLLILIFTAGSVFGLGVSPASVIFENANKGSVIEKQIYISGLEKGDIIDIRTEGDISNWINLDDNKITFSETKSMPITIKLTVPEYTPNGNYRGIIYVSSGKPNNKSEGTNLAVVSGVKLKVEVEVTGQEVKDYDINSIFISNTETNKKLPITIVIDNKGNVMAKPTHIELEIMDKFKNGQIFKKTINFDDGVKPHSRGELVLFVDHKLKPDNYWAIVKVFDKEIIHTQEIIFDILAEGSLNQSGIYNRINLPSQINLGHILKINAFFENTGELSIDAKLIAEIYKKNELIKVLESDLITIPTEQTLELSTYFNPEKAGDYRVVSYIKYSGKRTDTISADFSVYKPTITGNIVNDKQSNQYFYAAIPIIIVIVVLSFMFRFKDYVCKDCLYYHKLRNKIGKRCEVCSGELIKKKR